MGNALLDRAVHRHGPLSPSGLLERAFTASFQWLVYTWVGEDPEVDLAALALEPTSRVVAIASAGCNLLNYVALAEPASVVGVDLNPAQVALARLRVAAARHLDAETLFGLFGVGAGAANRLAYARLRPLLDGATRHFWERPLPNGGRRADDLVDGLYRRGLSGRFVGLLHAVARLHGVDLRQLVAAATLDEQRARFDRTLGALFARGHVRGVCDLPIALFGLGVPPAQFERLRAESGGRLADIFRERVRRLACDHPIATNYFAWQVFARGYDTVARRAVPPYLRADRSAALRDRAERVEIRHGSIAAYLAGQPDRSIDRYVLLDAPDWMGPAELAELWGQVDRTARAGARVVFRTLAAASPLDGAIPRRALAGWRTDPDRNAALLAGDRTGVYGGVHLYERA